MMAEERRFKTIDELTLMDDYMFAAVMRDTQHLKMFAGKSRNCILAMERRR